MIKISKNKRKKLRRKARRGLARHQYKVRREAGIPLTFKEERQEQSKVVQKRVMGFKEELKRTPTEAENKFRSLLFKHKITHQFQRVFYCHNFSCIVDFFIKTSYISIVIEIDGGYHNDPEQQRKDAYRTNWLVQNRRCRVIRFANEQVLTDPKGCMAKLAAFYFLAQDRATPQNKKQIDNHESLLRLCDKPPAKNPIQHRISSEDLPSTASVVINGRRLRPIPKGDEWMYTKF